MATLTVTLPSGSSVCDGKQVTFKAPCDSKGVTDIIINGIPYSLVDAMGESVSTGNSYKSGVMVSVILDTTGKKAYVQNAVNIDNKISTSISTSLSNYVDLTSAQEISGTKTFNSVAVKDTINITGTTTLVSADNIIRWYSGSPNSIKGTFSLSNYSGTAARATADGTGKNIADTYIAKAELFNSDGHLVLPSGVELW